MAGNNVIASVLNGINQDLALNIKTVMTWEKVFKILILSSVGPVLRCACVSNEKKRGGLSDLAERYDLSYIEFSATDLT